MSALEWKDKANAFFKNKNYSEALACYTEAVNADSSDNVHYSNRSVCHYNMNNFKDALEDANECIRLKPDWAKGYVRKGMAEVKLDLHDEAMATFKKGLEYEPTNQQLKENLDALKNPFLKNYSKLFTDPRTAHHMQDTSFKNLVDFAMKDQTMLMQLIQSDKRFSDVFAVLTGIDLTTLSEESSKMKQKKDEDSKERKKREEEERKREEEDRKKREEENKWNSLSEEEKDEEKRKRQAEELKLLGNTEFKKGNMEAALNHYNEAISLYPKELANYLNRAGVYHNLKEYEKVIEDCNHVVDNTYDFQKRARAFGKIAFVYKEQDQLDKAIEYFEKSKLEKTDQRILDGLKETISLKKKQDAERYINPELAEEHNLKGNDLYKGGKYPEALKEYNEAIKRNPTYAKLYSNRAACFIKLMEFSASVKDCDKALELDPMFLRVYQRKATSQFMMKEYHKALATYEQGLKLFPDDKDLKEGYSKVIMQINTSNPEDDEERVKHAYADPEIRQLVSDPRIQQLFKDLQENPKVANDAIMKDQFIATAFKKLVAAGIIKTK